MFVNPRRGGYPGPPGQPHGVKVGATDIELRWTAPTSSGGSGIQGVA